MNVFVKKKTSVNITIGIEASNLNSGGGLTHLQEILNNFNINNNRNICKIYVWSNNNTLSKIADGKFIHKLSNFYLERNIFLRFFWQIFMSNGEFKKKKCDIILVPGGTYLGFFKNIVSISQNLLPFTEEYKKYGIRSIYYYKFLILYFLQKHTFKKSKTVIFLTKYAKEIITSKVEIKQFTIIPHGINKKFISNKKKKIKRIEEYNSTKKFQLTYVSNIDVYKNHLNLINAFNKISSKYNLHLNLIGKIHPAMKKFFKNNILSILNDNITLNSSLNYEDMHKVYEKTDGFIFSSSCENMPNILLEAMASSLPIVSSNHRPMIDILNEDYIFFNPQNELEIYYSIEKLINKDYRLKTSNTSYNLSQNYSWNQTSNDIFKCLCDNLN